MNIAGVGKGGVADRQGQYWGTPMLFYEAVLVTRPGALLYLEHMNGDETQLLPREV